MIIRNGGGRCARCRASVDDYRCKIGRSRGCSISSHIYYTADEAIVCPIHKVNRPCFGDTRTSNRHISEGNKATIIKSQYMR